jgi:TRAP-type C4-dicarboxylate transport system permease large subunit
MSTIFRGSMPFLVAMIGVTILIAVFPGIALYLPSMMGR